MLHVSPADLPPDLPGPTIRISLAGQKSNGHSIRRMDGSNAIVTTFPIVDTAALRFWRNLAGPVVYVLVDRGADNVPLRLRLGVGRPQHPEACLQVALLSHARGHLTHAQARYLKRRLASVFAATCLVEITSPTARTAPLPRRLIEPTERFLRDALLLLGPIEPMLGLIASTAATLDRRAPAPTSPEGSP